MSALSIGRYGLVVIGLSGVLSAQEEHRISETPIQDQAGAVPEPVTDGDFEALKTHSPFLRSLGPSNSMILTATARIGETLYVSIFDTETTESQLISVSENREGWQLLGVQGDETDLESLTAKVQLNGGQVISVRYQKREPNFSKRKPGSTGSTKLSSSQMNEAKKAAAKYKEGFSADGYPRQPPPEIVKKLSKMSAQQRESINREMIELRNRGLGMEERRRIYDQKVDRASQGRR